MFLYSQRPVFKANNSRAMAKSKATHTASHVFLCFEKIKYSKAITAASNKAARKSTGKIMGAPL